MVGNPWRPAGQEMAENAENDDDDDDLKQTSSRIQRQLAAYVGLLLLLLSNSTATSMQEMSIIGATLGCLHGRC